jgi:hypothetical protein
MKIQLQIASLLAACLVFAACPYETHVPIDAPSVKIDSKLLGAWGDSENKNEIYTISKQDEFTYKIEITEEESLEKDTYLAYASMVKKITFLNILKPDSDYHSPTYLLYKMELENDNHITLTEVSENIDETFSSSSELKKFIGKNMKNTYFFGRAETNLIRL